MELENEMARGRQWVVARWAASQGRTPIAEGNQGRRGPRKEALGRWEVGCAGWVDTSGSLDPCPTEREGGRRTGGDGICGCSRHLPYLKPQHPQVGAGNWHSVCQLGSWQNADRTCTFGS